MPGEIENVRVVFDAETTNLAQAADVYTDIIKKDEALAEQAKSSADAMAKQGKDMTTLLSTNKKSIDDLSKSFQNLDKNIVGGNYRKVLLDMRTQLQLTDAQAKTFYQNLIKNSQQQIVSTQDLQQIAELQELLAAAGEELNNLGGEEEQVSQKSASLKSQLRAMKEELAAIDDTSNPKFIQLAEQAAKLEDKIKDTSEQVRLLSSDTRGIDAAIQTVQGLAGAYAIAQGSAALFGDENKDLQKAILQVNAAMTILQGIQQVMALLDKNSALNIYLIKTLHLQNAEAISAEAAAEEGATVAQKGLNAAMSANPAAVLIVSITALVALLTAFRSKNEEVTKSELELNQAMLENKKRLDEIKGLYVQVNDAQLKRLEDQLAIETAAGASEQRKFQLQKEIDTKRIDLANENLNKQLGVYNLDLDAFKFLQNGKLAELQITSKKISDLNTQIAESNSSADKERLNEQKKLLEITFSAQKEDYDKNIALINGVEQAEHQKNITLAEESKFYSDKRKQDLKEYQDLLNKLREQVLESSNLEILPPAEDTSIQDRVNNIIKGVDQIYARIKFNNSNDETALLGNLDLQFKKGTISFEEFNRQRELLSKDFAARDLDNQIAATQAKIQDLQYLGQNTDELQGQLNTLLNEKYDQDYQNFLAANQKKIEADQKRQQEIQIGQQIVSGFVNSFFQNEQAQSNEELARIEDLHSKKIITEEEYQKQVAQLRRKDAQDQKLQAVFSMLIQQGPALIKGFTQGGVAGIAAAASIFFSLLALTQGTRVPEFAEGVIGLQGPGTETSDSIPALLSRNESVMTAEATKRYRPALEAMNNLQFDEFIRNKYSTYLHTQIPEFNYSNSTEIDYEKLADAIVEKQGRISDIPASNINIDENGIFLIVKKGNEQTEFRNKRYSTN